jgi:hypothetical protein
VLANNDEGHTACVSEGWEEPKFCTYLIKHWMKCIFWPCEYDAITLQCSGCDSDWLLWGDWQNVMTLDCSRDSSGCFTNCSWLVAWSSTTTICSNSLIYLLDLCIAMKVAGGQVNSQLPSGLSLGLEGKWQGQVNWPLPWTSYPWWFSIPAL